MTMTAELPYPCCAHCSRRLHAPGRPGHRTPCDQCDLAALRAYLNALRREWEAGPAPCGISHADIFNPCLPERDERGLWCATCGLRQRLALT